MAYRYDFYPTPAPEGSGREGRFHTRVVPSGTIDTRGLAKLIHQASTATVGDVLLVAELLVNQIREQLSNGMRVHINGLGFLELTLENAPVHAPAKIRSESIHAKGVALRLDQDMKNALHGFTAVRVEKKKHSNKLSGLQVDYILKKHFEDNIYLKSKEFGQLCGFVHTTAARRIKELVSEGKLQKVGSNSSAFYLRGEKLV